MTMKTYKSKKGARKFKDGKEVKEPKMMLKRKRDGKRMSARQAMKERMREFMMERAGAKTTKTLRDIARNPKNYKPYKSKKK
tara:strand:- start:325 stop:570 length:246 start_codon:yes stop_codon:yes gene_type:complete